MATTFKDYDGDGNNNKTFDFPSYQSSDVKVEVDGVVKTVTTHYNITGYTTTGGGTIEFTAGNIPASGTNIRIYRDTDVDSAKATFIAGSSVKAVDLNNNSTQILYAQQEEKNQTITTQDIKDNAITSAKILGNAVNSAHLADNSVGSSELQADSVGSVQIKDNAVGSSEIAANAVGSAQIADGAVTSSELASDSVGTTQLKDNSVTSANIAADAVGSAQIADGAVGASEIAANAVGAAQIQDGAVGSSELAANSVGSAQISDGAVGSSEIAADAVGSAQISDGAVGASEIAANAVGSAQISDGAVGASEIAANAVGSAQIADDAVGSSEIAADAITSGHIADGAVGSSEIVGNAINSAHIADGAVGSSELDANSVGNVQMKDNAITMDEIGCEETTITDDDTKLPTSGAVVDYVTTQISNIGGLKVIADEDNFPTSQPASGVVISIADAGGVVFNGSGVSTTARTAGNGSDNVTINGAPSSLYSETIAAGVGMQVSSTGSSHTYTYHKILSSESDVKQLSDDINDFNSRYRIASSAPGSNNDEGDLYFDTSANKMYVYDGSAWGQVTSTGEFKILGVKDNGQAHNGSGPTFNGSNDQFDLFEGTSDASINQAAQLTVVLNGVQQKPNDGSWSGSEEGFYLDGADGIRFCDPPPSGSTLFVIKSGSATEIAVPADNSVSAGKTDISLVQGDIIYSNGTDSWTRLGKGTAGQVLKMNSGETAPEWGTDSGLTQEQVEDFVGGMLDGTETGITVSYDDTDGNIDFVVDDTSKLPLAGGTVTGSIVYDNGTNAGKDLNWNVDWSGNAELRFDDDVYANFGDDRDMQVYHSNLNAKITNFKGDLTVETKDVASSGAGDLYLKSHDDIFIQPQAGESGIKVIGNGAVQLYHDNTKKLETTADGISIPGSVNTTDGLVDTSGGNFDIKSTGRVVIYVADTEKAIYCDNNGAVELYFNDTKEFATKSGGVKLFGHSEQVINTLTSASSVTIDFSLANIHTITMGHNVTFPDPSNESVGQSGSIILTQDGTGGRTADWSDAAWRFVGGNAPTLSSAAGAVDRIDYLVVAAGNIHCVASLDVK